MINKEDFVKGINTYKKFIETSDRLEELGVNLFEGPLTDSIDTLFDLWVNSLLDEEGVDLIYWWLFEDVDKIIYDNEEEIIVETVEQLYDYICKNYSKE